MAYKKGYDESLLDGVLTGRERYINPYTDFGFKKLFGTEMNKDLLISFLNALLDNGRNKITDVQYLNTENLGARQDDRRSVFDVYCKTKDGSRFIVEMQKAEQSYFKDRSVYYATTPIREQAKKGKWDYHLENDDKLTFVYLEMPKFRKTEDELVTMFDKWMYVLQNLARLMERPKALQDRVFKKLFRQAEIAQYGEAERRQYEFSLKEYWDYTSTLDTAYTKGERKGREEGREEGRAEGREEGMAEGLEKGIEKANRENARRMKADGMPTELIAKYTGLTAEQINSL